MYSYSKHYCDKESNIDDHKIDKIFKFLHVTNSKTPFYKVIHKQDLQNNIATCSQVVKFIGDNFNEYIFIGMGGAILNPMMMHSISNTTKKVSFINTTDVSEIVKILDRVSSKAAFIVISNTGETLETLSILGAIVSKFIDCKLDFARNIFVCTSNKPNTLNKFAQKNNIIIIEYDEDVGGRFSCFSNASILPALLFGIDLQKLQSSANEVVADFWLNKAKSKPAMAAIDIYNANLPNMVAISYCCKTEIFLKWYCQIIAESLGKNLKGYTPLYGIGPQEQHSLLQLYLDGPKDKLFTLVDTKTNANAKIKMAKNVFEGHFLNNQALTNINNALFNSTRDCLIDNGCKVRILKHDIFDETALGALIMHCIIEIIFLSLLMGVDPFNQPGVDELKIKAKKFFE